MGQQLHYLSDPSVPLHFLCYSLTSSPLDYGSSLLNLPCILPPLVSPLSILHTAAQAIFLKHMSLCHFPVQNPQSQTPKSGMQGLTFFTRFTSVTSILYLAYIVEPLYFAECPKLFHHSVTLKFCFFFLKYPSYFSNLRYFCSFLRIQ